MKVVDIARAIYKNPKFKIIGIRPGEKIHEEMITSSDSFSTYDLGKYYAILPQVTNWNIDSFKKEFNASKVPIGFQYNSAENQEWVGVEEIRSLIIKYVDSDFKV